MRALRRGGWCLCLTVVPALPRAKRGDVGAVHAAVGTVAPGVTAARVDEYALAAGRLAHAEPVDAHVGEPDGEARNPSRLASRSPSSPPAPAVFTSRTASSA